MFTRSQRIMLRACILSQYHLDKAFHFPGKCHFLVKTITGTVRLGVVYLNIVLSRANRVLFCEIYFVKVICLQSVAHNDITTIHDLFIYFISIFLADPRSSFSSKPWGYAHNTVLFFDYWSNQLFQSNQRFQAIEFADRARPVPEKLDVGFLFYGHEVLQVECMIVKYKATRINTSVTHT